MTHDKYEKDILRALQRIAGSLEKIESMLDKRYAGWFTYGDVEDIDRSSMYENCMMEYSFKRDSGYPSNCVSKEELDEK